jgi:uncharacterized protein (UPF0212 family)
MLNAILLSLQDKTSETLNLASKLAEAVNANPSTSGSSADNVVSKAKSKDDDLNANLSEMTKRLNDIDMSFRQKVVTQESSCDLMTTKQGPEISKMEDEALNPLEAGAIIEETGLPTAVYDDEGLLMEPDAGTLYNQMLKINKLDPNAYAEEFVEEVRTVENIQVRPEVVSCPKCGRKVAHGAIHHHIKYCNPE